MNGDTAMSNPTLTGLLREALRRKRMRLARPARGAWLSAAAGERAPTARLRSMVPPTNWMPGATIRGG